MRRPILKFSSIAFVSMIALSACATESDPSASTSSETSASAGVTISGEWGATPTAEFTSPLTISQSSNSVVIEGDGEEILQGDGVNVYMTMYGGQSGQIISQSNYAEQEMNLIIADTELIMPGIADAMIGAKIGSRVVSEIAPADAFGDQGSTDLGIAANESLVAILDLIEKAPLIATGQQQDVDATLPGVSLDESGKPTVTVPESDPPTELTIAVLKKGDGAVVNDEASVTVQYQGINWRTGEVFDQSWSDDGSPSAPANFSTTQVVPGFGTAIEGQTVGSQIIAILPPSEGYGETGAPSAGIEPTDTMIFVIDILATIG